MKKLKLALCVFLAALTFASCSCGNDKLTEKDLLWADKKQTNSATYNFDQNKSAPPNSYSSYRSSSIQFAIDILSARYKEGKSFVFSPAGLHSSLAFLENAASGSTQKQIKKLVNPNALLSDINEGNGYLFSRVTSLNSDKSYAVLDNNTFVSNGTTVSGDVQQKCADFFKHGLFKLDFSDSKSLEKANEYVSEKTNGRCKGILSSLDKQLNLTSAVYMSDNWLGGFTEKDGWLCGTEYYLEGKNCSGFIKNFKNTPCKFIALKPDKDISSMLETFNATEYLSIIDSMDILTTVDVKMKKFSLSDKTEYSDLLKKQGVSEIFSSGNFGALSYGKKASVEKIVQSCSLKLDSKGVDTSSSADKATGKKEAEKTLSFDSHYIFMIVDNESYIPILMGVAS